MIYEYITEICDILGIQVPNVSFDTSSFQSDTMMAQCSSDGNTIYIKQCEKLNLDQCFAIAHELRHVWQIKYDKKLFFSTYKPRELCNSIEEYNLQFAEIDANAFSGIVTVDLFCRKPLFNGVSDSVKSKIYERMEYIAATEFAQ